MASEETASQHVERAKKWRTHCLDRPLNPDLEEHLAGQIVAASGQQDKRRVMNINRQADETPHRCYRSAPYRRLDAAYHSLFAQWLAAGRTFEDLKPSSRFPAEDAHAAGIARARPMPKTMNKEIELEEMD